MYHRIIIKVGTASLTRGKNALDQSYMEELTHAIAALKKQNKQVILVTSGAMGASKEFLKLKATKKKGTTTRQAMAAVGQIYLMKIYWELLGKHNLIAAQVLLTREDFNHRKRYLNLRNTLLNLLQENVIPIINENDVVATEELEGVNFGDNDTLSALVSTAIDADLLIILSDIEGLYTNNPKKDPTAKLIKIVKKIDKTIESAINEDKSKLGVWGGGAGGMQTKINAARIATEHGTEMVIASGEKPAIIGQIVNNQEKKSTRFLPLTTKEKNKKKWLATYATNGKAKLFIDQNAEKALLANKSLLPVGIKKVEGKADRGDTVEIYNENDEKIAKGLLEYSLDDINKIKNKRSSEIEAILGYTHAEEAIHKDNLLLIHKG
ncbi:MAG: glutamate 5-kinase [bacterium]